MQSIHEALAEENYVRVKVGIGRPRFNEAIEDYVLASWYEDQRHQVAEIVTAAVAAVEAIFTEGLEKAMTVVNAKHSPLPAT